MIAVAPAPADGPAKVPVEPRLTRVTVATLAAEMELAPAASWGEAIRVVLERHIGEVLAP